ncbi:hypothetical protein J5J10_09315 [Ciceribacter sp. L1K23]|uniref:hypothetical protein n=1 Tax=Ciceribacter sp. L1K23 TaxID=2820276 RepID=UPI001B8365FD|nr:hypothetical protein [Ciceribacter sp. L1K23]MBR0555877.1 hypothetical protein [Ciceribacter sp. L1K23]
MKTETYMSLFVGMMINAMLFGVGAVAVLSIPALEPYWKFLIPLVVVLAYLLTYPIASRIAPQLRLRNRPDGRTADIPGTYDAGHR